ncbi:MAG: EamA family transporter [Patescibacteria group bacterium]|nr:EamA family transporter [Patescibacteria group bacterium]
MTWILIAFISPILHAFANILDNYLTNKLFKSVWTMAFFSAFFAVVFLPLTFFIQIPGIPPVHLLPFFFIIGLIEVFYLFPYYKALQDDDTSVVSSLFSIGKIFVPVFAFLLVGEILRPAQYLGFIVIIFASAALTLNNHGKFRFNKSLVYMLACSFMLSLEAVIYKYLFESVSWSTGFVWTTIITFLIAATFLLIPKLSKDIRNQVRNFKDSARIFTFEELLTFSGAVTSTYVISLVPVTLEKSIDSFQPFFVLLYAIVLQRLYPRLFKERIDGRSVSKK